jgi:cytochrome c oxidase subunit 3
VKKASLQDEAQGEAEQLVRTISMRRFGMGLFLVSLAVFFAGSMVVYVVTSLSRPPAIGQSATSLPAISWFSTLLLLFAGIAMEVAAQRGRWGFIDQRRALLAASGLSIAFLITQAVAIFQLLGQHYEALQTHDIGIFGLTLVLMLIHAAHIGGGLIPLNMLAMRAWNHRLTPTHSQNVRGCATYWHFLELVWLSMFAAFLLLG